MVRYLLIDNRDGRLVAELDSAEQAARLLGRAIRDPYGDPLISLIRLEHHDGDLVDTSSVVSMRPLTW